MKLIIFDFEVFKYDVLLGMYIVDNEDRSKKQLYQTWDKTEIKKLYQLFKEDIWVGHNNKYYDNHILESVVRDKDSFNTSQNIIEKHSKKGWINIPLYYFDLNEEVTIKLKITEAYFGKSIDVLNEVPWDIDRPLTEEEKKRTEEYNKSDLDQTYENFLSLSKNLDLKLALIKEFNLDYSMLSKSISNVGATVLNVKKDESKLIDLEPYVFPQLKIKNKDVWDWYIKKRYLNEHLITTINNVEHTLGIGGIHGAKKQYYAESDEFTTIWYFDVAGYYNRIMINLDLFSRSMTKESKELYAYLFNEQLKLKKIDPVKRLVYKVVLLSVFGAMNNKYTEFYDAHHYNMVTLNGQLFLIDLLEKLDPYIELIQSNTDGIILKAKKEDDEKILEIINEWMNRTDFVLKQEKVKKIFQRDVNAYVVEKENGEINILGEPLKYARTYKSPFEGTGAFKYKEPIVLSILLKEALLGNGMPEEIIEKYKNDLTLFQFICKKETFRKLVLNKDGIDYDIQEVSRVFPSKTKDDSMIYKVKGSQRVKISGLPQGVFVYNNDIRSQDVINELSSKIDWDWYITRAYEKIGQFLSDES